MKQALFTHRHRIVICLFLAFHAITCMCTNLFGDDFYYASFVRNGTDFLISENISHYLTANGRALVHLADELLIGWSFWLWRASAVAVTGALVIVLARLAARSYRPDANPELYNSAVVAVCALLAVTDIAVLRQSVYWATGSLNYLFPATLTMWFIYRLRRDFYRDTPDRMLPVLAFFAAFTTEQASAAALLAALYTIALAIVQKRRIRRVWILSAILAAAAFSTILLAPGNAFRMSLYPDFYAMPLLRRVFANVPTMAAVVMGPNGIYSLMLALLLVSARELWKLHPILGAIPISGICIYSFGVTRQPEILTKWWILALIVPPLAFIIAKSLVDFVRRGESDNLLFLWGGAAMQAAMLFTPEFGPRTLMMTLVMLVVPLARYFIEENSPVLYAAAAAIVLLILPTDMPGLAIFLLIFTIGLLCTIVFFRSFSHRSACLAVAVSLALFATVPVGYAQNLSAYAANLASLETYDPTSDEPLTLYYLPNDTYRYTMPYDNLYHKYALMRLYGLPDETEIRCEFVQ